VRDGAVAACCGRLGRGAEGRGGARWWADCGRDGATARAGPERGEWAVGKKGEGELGHSGQMQGGIGLLLFIKLFFSFLFLLP